MTDPEAVYKAALAASDHATALNAVYNAGLADGAASANTAAPAPEPVAVEAAVQGDPSA